MSQKSYYQKPIKEVLVNLNTTQDGLQQKEARKRQQQDGKNKIDTARKKTVFNILFAQIANILTILLIVAAIISIIAGHNIDALVIFIAAAINIAIGTIQEYKAEQELQALQHIKTTTAVVLRNGHRKEVLTEELVKGDIVLIEQGQKVPADMRIIEEHKLKVSEAILTGESRAEAKTSETIKEFCTINEQKNMLFMGTSATTGSGRAVVTEVGYKTELGAIMESIRTEPETLTPLQQQIKKLTWWIGGISLAIVVLVLIIGTIRGESVQEMLPLAISLAVASVPEGLATGVFIVLAIGMRRMLKKKALTQKLVAAETLGSVSVLCVDKTGTLTKGQMSLQEIHTLGGTIQNIATDWKKAAPTTYEAKELLSVAIMASDAFCKEKIKDIHKWECVGDETEQAIIRGAALAEISQQETEQRYRRLDIIPFDSETKYMATLHQDDGDKNKIAIKGAPEVVIPMCSKAWTESGEQEFNSRLEEKWLQITRELSERGLRVIAVAKRSINTAKQNLEEEHLTSCALIGLLAFEDPIREGARHTIQEIKKAGMRTMIVTGDHKSIAANIAESIGLNSAPTAILEGKELAKLTNDELKARIDNVSVFARISPQDKLRIVKTLKEKGEVVGMTGDGVNDAPALHAADIGIAVASGTDIAKEAADMVLLDDHIQTIVDAVREGRRMYSNILKIVRYLLSDSFTEIFIIVLALLLAMPSPLAAVHILWINIASDGFIDIALALEPEEKGEMQKPPRKKHEKILNGYTQAIIVVVTIISGIAAFGLFWWAYKTTGDLTYARTMPFTLLAIDSIFYVLSIRATNKSILQSNPFRNKWLILSMIITIILQIIALYIPFMQKALHTVPLSLKDWSIIVILVVLIITGIEGVKMMIHARDKQQ